MKLATEFDAAHELVRPAAYDPPAALPQASSTSRPLGSSTVYIFINGILSMPASADGWTDRAVTWTHTRTAHRAEKWEYAAGPLTRRFRQQARAEKISVMVGYYQRAGFAVVLAGHSNGCDLIARVLRLCGTGWAYPRPIAAAHLYAPAADGDDFLNELELGGVGAVHLHLAGRDRALQAARWTQRLFGWAGLGYGTLGIEPEHNLTYAPGCTVTMHEGFGHSDFFTRGENFELTMCGLHAPDSNHEK